jgi:DNA end-binding protein Ku
MAKAARTVADIASQLSAVLKPQPANAPQAAPKEKVYVSKATWTGTISVAPGLAFKAKLYKATNDPTEGFKSNMVHQCSAAANDGTVEYSQLKQGSMKCSVCGVDVPKESVQKGIPNGDGTFTIISDDEKKSCMVRSEGEMQVLRLVPSRDVDPIYFDGASEFLGPEKGAEKFYVGLRKMLGKGLVALAVNVQRGQEYMLVLRPYGKDGIIANYIRREHEVRACDKFPMVALSQQEEGLFSQLADALTGRFDTEEFPDTYASNLRGLIVAKQSGTAAPVVEKQAPAAVAVDLMAALQASINAAKAKQGGQPVAVAEQLIAEKAAEANTAAKFAIN